jgi:hypothetical protein
MDVLVIVGYVAAFAAGYWLRSYLSWRRRWGRDGRWGRS